MKRSTMVVVCSLALAFCAVSAWGQAPPADTLKVDYFANANTAGAPDGTLRITNPGTAGANLCAAIFVFDPSQELSECCRCFVSPDGLRTLSVNTNLTGDRRRADRGRGQDCFDQGARVGRLPAAHPPVSDGGHPRVGYSHPEQQFLDH